MRGWPRAGAAALWIAAATGCGTVGPPGEPITDLESAQAKWSETRPHTYRFGVQRDCFCAPDARGPVHVTVSGTEVVARTYLYGGEPVPAAFQELFPSVDGLFEVLRDAFERGAYSVTVEYDPDSGVPLQLFIDYQTMLADEELGFTVVEAVGTPGS